MLLALVFVFSVLFIPVQAADTAGVAVSGTISLDDLDSNPDVIVSDPMTFTEMIARMAKNIIIITFCFCSIMPFKREK